MYGTTETTVHATYRRITMDDLDKSYNSPIGAPLPDLTLYLLDQSRHKVSLNTIGEIYIGGEGVSRGYLNRPDLTLERFIDSPFDSK